MPSDSVKFTVKPALETVKRRHEERLGKIKNLRKPYAEAAVFLDRWVQLNFKTEGGNVGGWAPFSPHNRRKIDDPAAKLLQDTGRLRLSFLPFTSARDAGVGSDLPYAEKHHEGEGKRLPARRLLPKQREVQRDLRKILNDHVRESIR